MVWAKADSTRPSTIVENAGDEPSVATAKVESDKRNLDYNAATGAVGARLEMNYSVRRGKRPHAGESRTIRRRAAFFWGCVEDRAEAGCGSQSGLCCHSSYPFRVHKGDRYTLKPAFQDQRCYSGVISRFTIDVFWGG
ncbi:hypothetical protein [Sulfuritalea sp.]|uniref:hypothetical protein n=1 Tax=Sulfuritalea sp. TaxID=2480090 RepID=UPI001AC85DCC|nr:hypothetical protein [Sulfuritalea sp.]MBN8476102.1 hypothetical protein [Sulfuritalea sp.]